MDWAKVIDRNRELLLRIVAALFAVAGLDDGATPATLPRCTRNYVMRILRPAESALRRLIVIAARDIGIEPRPSSPVILDLDARTSQAPSLLARTHSAKPAKASLKKNKATPQPTAARPPAFPVSDPLKRFDFSPPRRRPKSVPRITFIGLTELRPIPERHEPSPGDAVDATRLYRRLVALKHALDDLPRAARRLARWRARQEAKPFGRTSPLRPGYAPGRRKRRTHEVDEVLHDLQLQAQYALKSPNTS
jgi:hypothetical protein